MSGPILRRISRLAILRARSASARAGWRCSAASDGRLRPDLRPPRSQMSQSSAL